MSTVKNVMFIMADQLRYDYLSCYGHPHLHTPHLDRLAAKGVQFNNAYVQSPFCGPSRMSTYTGRYCRSHGATWNGFPLRISERTMADHLRAIGVRPAIVGKTHVIPNLEDMEWLGIDPESDRGKLIAQAGFEPFERDDGMHPYTAYDPDPPYNDWLHSKGINSPNPWDDHANSGIDADGNRRSGWLLKYSDLPADIPEELSETPYMTGRAIDFIEEAGDQPWMCHLSFIKPHWPYIVPAPYHDMYGPQHLIPVNRTEAERDNAHPIHKAYIESRICSMFCRDEVREKVLPIYMGLVKQIDDQMGRLFAYMEEKGLMENTMIVFTSDHGDNFGDHWMGEKDLFHDSSAKVPLIIYDPRPEADATRGQVRDELVECIDLTPTFLSAMGGAQKPELIEGVNLEPLLHAAGTPADWRDYLFSEYDFATREARATLGLRHDRANLVMVRDDRWKYVHAEDFRPMLFDLETDPEELVDLGASEDPEHVAVRGRLADAINGWARQHHNRSTKPPAWIEKVTGGEPHGVIIGVWDEEDYETHFGEPWSFGPYAEANLGKT